MNIQSAIKAALAAYNVHKDVVKNHDHMFVVDMTMHNAQRRGFLVRIRDGGIFDSFLVAHGSGSQSANLGHADKFSDTPMSRKTSLGAMVTGDTYIGKYGRSLRLHGLDKGVNDNVYKRSIVVHGANYVSFAYALKNKRIGNSWGCLALDFLDKDRLIDLIKEGAFVYVYFE